MFHVSVIAPNATMVVYGILFGVMHPPVRINARKLNYILKCLHSIALVRDEERSRTEHVFLSLY